MTKRLKPKTIMIGTIYCKAAVVREVRKMKLKRLNKLIKMTLLVTRPYVSRGTDF